MNGDRTPVFLPQLDCFFSESTDISPDRLPRDASLSLGESDKLEVCPP